VPQPGLPAADEELTVISDILRRLNSRGWSTKLPEFRPALAKVEDAKAESYGWVPDPTETDLWVLEAFPVTR
jgi:hypothetical protein